MDRESIGYLCSGTNCDWTVIGKHEARGQTVGVRRTEESEVMEIQLDLASLLHVRRLYCMEVPGHIEREQDLSALRIAKQSKSKFLARTNECMNISPSR